ncbi:MAG: PHP domain-containing protein [Kineosporiaceae bacterium]|nr:PHP domain-containing protein [Aeromicrobium sp.]
MRIDLHTHSNRSDGTDSPTELIENAKAAGLDVVALTDHDCTDGWREASKAAKRVGIELVKGIEISCRLDGKSIHLLGYEFDPNNGPLVEELRRVIDGRNSRLPATLERLRGLGIEIEARDVRRWSGNAAAMGRPHIADALIELGVVASRNEAFDRFLMPGKAAYVDRYAADLFGAIGLLNAAGGVAVIAHPWSRGSHKVLTASMFAKLREAGLSGIEIDHNDHDQEDRALLRQIARELDFVQTGSSDYHGTGKIDFDLGCNTTAYNQFQKLRGRKPRHVG